MAELELHHEGHGDDPNGKRIGMLAAVLAVLLAVVTILSHRAHTDAVVMKTEANDQWAFYQAKSIKSTVLGAAHDMLAASQGKNESAAAVLERYQSERKRYEEENKEIQSKAREFDAESKANEHKALRFDLGEGMLEIGLVMTSMYFIARRMMFPIVGLMAGIGGVLVALAGLMTH
jgi:Domain of unknown function (DUF4337)